MASITRNKAVSEKQGADANSNASAPAGMLRAQDDEGKQKAGEGGAYDSRASYIEYMRLHAPLEY
jgi:hypothetical protein